MDVACEPCKERGKSMSSAKWCVNCEEALCNDCTESHRAMKVSRNHQLIDIDQMPAQEQIITQSCSEHENLPFDYFCVDHDSLSCKECLAEQHRTCAKVVSVDIASKGAKESQSYLDVIQLLTQILETTCKFSSDRQICIQAVEDEAEVVKNKIQEARVRMVSYVESLETSLLQDLNCHKEKVITKLKESISKAETLEAKAKNQKDTFELVEKHGTDRQAFLLTQTSRRTLADVEEEVAIVSEKAMNAAVSFSGINCEDTAVALGSLKWVESPCNIKFVPQKKRQSQIPVVEVRLGKRAAFILNGEIDLKAFDGSTFIMGMTKFENLLLLCDFSNPRILVYDEENAHKFQIETKYYPWDIAMIPNSNTAVTSCYADEYIQFVDIIKRKMIKVVKVPRSNVGGIATSADHIYLGSVGKIVIFDHQGNLFRAIRIQPDASSTPWFISIGINEHIYYSTPSALFGLHPDGKALFSYASPELKTPRKVQTDKLAYIYVVGSDSRNIQVIKPNGAPLDVVLQREDGLDYPIAFCFDQTCTKMYISNKNGTTISVYKQKD